MWEIGKKVKREGPAPHPHQSAGGWLAGVCLKNEGGSQNGGLHWLKRRAQSGGVLMGEKEVGQNA